MKKLQIFVSSTYLDLRDERQAAVEAILTAGHIPAGMELFVAGDESQWEIIKEWIDGSDIYCLILGGRYGSIEPKSGLSYTEKEFDYALSKKKPLFSIVINDKAIEEKVKKDGTKVIERSNQNKLDFFRDKVCSRMVKFFEDTKDIKLAVYESLNYLSKKHNLSGWVRADSIPDPKKVIEEVDRATSALSAFRQYDPILKNIWDNRRAYDKSIFLMMPFKNTVEYRATYKIIREVCEEKGYSLVRIDQSEEQHSHTLWENLVINMLSCKYAIAVYSSEPVVDRPGSDLRVFPNPNISFEFGFFKARGQEVCLLRDRSSYVPPDMQGFLWYDFDIKNPDVSIPESISRFIDNLNESGAEQVASPDR